MPFIEKLSFLLANPARFGDCLRWDASGTTFVLAHANPRLQAEILPRIFSHRNVPSFTRACGVFDTSGDCLLTVCIPLTGQLNVRSTLRPP